jgi:hypothetical protein
MMVVVVVVVVIPLNQSSVYYLFLSLGQRHYNERKLTLLISNFRCVLNVVFSLLGDSPASEFYVPTFRNTLFRISLFHRAFSFTIFICSNKCTFLNITLFQCELLKH